MTTISMNNPGAAASVHRGFLTPSKKAVWWGRGLSGFAVLFLLFDASMKLFFVPQALEGSADLGFPKDAALVLGWLEVICLAFYLLPRTAILGAILWTGYLGGAIATHLRVGNPLLSHTLFPVYIALLLWVGLGLRDSRLRAAFAGFFIRNP